MVHNHPVRRAMIVLRLWLGTLCFMMFFNAQTATPYLLDHPLGSIPFYFSGFLAFFWMTNIWDSKVVISCCSLIVVGTFLRGIEVLVYADQFGLKQRLTGVSLWWFVSITTLAFGVINLIGVSRKIAEDWIWKEESLSS